MTGQALSRVRNPYPEATRLERRRVQHVLRWLLDVEQRVEDVFPIAATILMVCVVLEAIATASRAWPAR